MAIENYNILLAEDDEDLRTIVRDLLKKSGYAVDEATDGNDALQMLGSDTYDLLLLDINMPGKSGVEVLQYIKQNKLACRVIMLTGTVGLNAAIDSLKLGASDYITKPFNVNYLLASVKRVLSLPNTTA